MDPIIDFFPVVRPMRSEVVLPANKVKRLVCSNLWLEEVIRVQDDQSPLSASDLQNEEFSEDAFLVVCPRVACAN